MSRIDDTFARLRAASRPGLITYVTAGDPDARRSALILHAVDAAGADLLEVGVPFSDPLADGPMIQRASERALASGMTLAGTLDLIGRERATIGAPVVLFTYVNPILRLGVDRFAHAAARAGVDGVLVLDLPLEEAGDLRASLDRAGLDTIFLLSPTTTLERIREAARLGRGFLYAISRAGVTGAREAMAEGAAALCARIRRETSLPIALGFGLSRPEHVAEAGRIADAAVVGSALVEVVARNAESPGLAGEVERFVRWLRGGATSAGAVSVESVARQYSSVDAPQPGAVDSKEESPWPRTRKPMPGRGS
jgi:tryptophan synthase alpha chain